MIIYWWCPECKVEVASANVTNGEKHDKCGCMLIVKQIKEEDVYDCTEHTKEKSNSGAVVEISIDRYEKLIMSEKAVDLLADSLSQAECNYCPCDCEEMAHNCPLTIKNWAMQKAVEKE